MMLWVRVAPRSAREKIVGLMADGSLKVSVTAPPADNRANEALISLLSRELKAPKSAIRIRAGGASRRKLLEIDGIDERSLPLAGKE